MRTRIFLAILVLIGTHVGAARSAQEAQKAIPALSIVASATEDVVRAGSQVTLKVSVKNELTETLVEPTDGMNRPERNYAIKITDDHGNVPPLTNYGRALIKHEGVIIDRCCPSMILQPGETRNEDVVVTSLFDLSKPGKYTIQLERFDNSIKAGVKSNAVAVTVTP
jgi:hypothetical protein